MTYKEKVTRCCPMVGTHINLTDPAVTELEAGIGFDYLWIDMEHTYISEECLHNHLLAARAGGTPTLIRLPATDLTVTKRVLEMGPDAVVFPMVENAAHARELLSDTLYPPLGSRGCGPKGAIRYGLDDERAYYATGHLKMCRFVQIERKTAALEAEAIAAIPYLDGCVLGLFDLSGSVGDPGNIWGDETMALAKHAIDAFRKAGKTVGISTFADDDATIARLHRLGINMITTGADYEYIRKGALDTLRRARAIQAE